MWSLCTEVAFYVVMPLTAYLLAAARRRTGLHLPTVVGRGLVIAALGVAWQVVVRPHPRPRGPLRAVAARLHAVVHGRAVLRRGQRRPDAPAARPRARPDRQRPGRLLDPGRRRLRHRLHPGRRPPHAGHAARLGGRHQGRPLHRSRPASSCCRWCSARSARDGSATSSSGPVPFWLGDISYGVFAIHLFVMGVLFRVLDIVPFTGHFFTILTLDAAITLAIATLVVALLREPDPEVQERALDGAPRAPRDPGRSRVPGTSTGASSAALTAASASIAHAWAQ